MLPHLGAIVGVASRAPMRPVLSIITRDGRAITTDSLEGRVVLLNVWATWCFPCRAEMPAMQRLSGAYPANAFTVIGLSVDQGPPSDVDAFLRERGITYPVAIIDWSTIDALGGVRGYPTSILLDKHGKIRHVVLGPIGAVTLRPAIARLVGEK